MIPISGRGEAVRRLPSTWDHRRGIIDVMQRFEVGERVLVCKFMGASYAPPRRAVVLAAYSASYQGRLFDYFVESDGKRYKVRDAWLAPFSVTIHEEPEYADLV